MKKTWNVKRFSDWGRVAKDVAALLKPGMILTLTGPLGAGKTTFVQYLARELGVKGSPKSPTFSLVRTYALRVPCLAGRQARSALRRLVHVDAYRIEKPEDILPLNLDEELAASGTVMALEWPENTGPWLKSRMSVTLSITIETHPDGSRTVGLEGLNV